MVTFFVKRWHAFAAMALILPLLLGIGLISASAETPHEIKGQTATITASPKAAVQTASSAPQPTAEQIANSEKGLDYIHKINAARTEPNATVHAAAAPPKGVAETNPKAIETNPQLPGDLTIFRSTNASAPVTAGNKSSIQEPSQSASGKDVFYTGNWYAAISHDGGSSFAYVNPYAGFVGGDPAGFCCDQDVIYEPARNVLLWERMGLGDFDKNNTVDIGVSTDGGATFCTYAFKGSNVGRPNTFLDYPHMSVTRNAVYITYNIFDSAGFFVTMGMSRYSLDALITCGTATATFWEDAGGYSWAMGQGQLTDGVVMYLGDARNSAGTFRIYYQKDTDNSLFAFDRAVAPWTFTNRGDAICTTGNGTNPCARLNQKVRGGWTNSVEIGFFWTVGQGGAYARPYIDAVTFDRRDLSVTGQPQIFSSTTSFTYGAAATNSHSNVGITGLYIPDGGYPTMFLGINDDYQAKWTVYGVSPASNTWGANNMGDYVTVRTYEPANTLFTAANYIDTSGVYSGYYLVFGRGRDANAFNRWNNT